MHHTFIEIKDLWHSYTRMKNLKNYWNRGTVYQMIFHFQTSYAVKTKTKLSGMTYFGSMEWLTSL